MQENYDYILSMNDINLVKVEMKKISELVKDYVDRSVELRVYNSSTRETRRVSLRPSSNWPGDGLLGIELKLVVYD